MDIPSLNLQPSPIFSIPPILHLILSHLDQWTLLHATRINHTFNHLITNSTTLQRALFFQPTPFTPLITKLYLDEPPRPQRLIHFNPLLVSLFPIFFPHSDVEVRRSSFVLLSWDKDERTRAAFTRKEASWRRMHLSSPPLPTSLEISTSGRMGTINQTATLSPSPIPSPSLPDPGPKHLTMALLWDILYETVIAKRSGYPNFSIGWGECEAWTEEESLSAARAWEEERAVWVERGEVVLKVSYSSGCIQALLQDLGTGFRCERMRGLKERGVALKEESEGLWENWR